MTDNVPAWRKALRPASFRGQPFAVKNATTQVGRRTVIHEYPQRDEAFPEDLGRKARAFTVEAVIVGPDYMKARDALIEALETAGAGELVHPYYGRRTVTLASPARISETPDEGGMARFSMDFVEAGENTEPSAREDTQSIVDEQADVAQAANAADFSDSFNLDGLPAFSVNGAVDVARDAMRAIDGVRRAIIPDISILGTWLQAAAGVSAALSNLLRAPGSFASSLLGLFAGLTALGNGPLAAIQSYRGLFGYGTKPLSGRSTYTRYGSPLPNVSAATTVRQRQTRNQEAIAALVRRAAVIECVRLSSRLSFDSYDQAVALRDELADFLDAEAAGESISAAALAAGVTVPDAMYSVLLDLRAAMIRDITARGANLARLSKVELPATLPALVAAYRIHGDATRDSELVGRNAGLVRHPGFVPGGVPLEVLTS